MTQPDANGGNNESKYTVDEQVPPSPTEVSKKKANVNQYFQKHKVKDLKSHQTQELIDENGNPINLLSVGSNKDDDIQRASRFTSGTTNMVKMVNTITITITIEIIQQQCH